MSKPDSIEMRMRECRKIARKFFRNYNLIAKHPYPEESMIEHMAVLLDTQWLDGWIKADEEAHALAIKTGAM